MSSPRLVYIEWEDSASGGGWQNIEDIQQENRAPICKSVGWLVSSDKHAKTVVPNILTRKVRPMGCEAMTIPTSAIRRLILLVEPKGKKRR